MPIFEDPIITISEPNGDGTTDHQLGSFSPFNVIVLSNTGASVIPAERTGYSFYSYGDTLPSDVDVQVSR
jgi:hypothetical protein